MFSEHLSLEQFTEALPLEGKEWQSFRSTTLRQALLSFAEELRDVGRLKKISGLKNRDIRHADSWNTFIDGGVCKDYWWIDSMFRGPFIRAMVSAEYKEVLESYPRTKYEDIPHDEFCKIAYDMLCEVYDSGNTGIHWNIEFMEDSFTGDAVHITLNDFTPNIIKYVGREQVPITDADPIPLVKEEVQINSGTLVFSDCFRVGSYKDNTDLGYSHELSINHAQGIRNCTIKYLKEYGVAYTQTTNTTVTIIKKNNTLVVIDSYYETLPTGWEVVGTHSCDVWRTEAVDLNVLRDLAVLNMSKLGIYLEHSDSAVVEVDKGTYTFMNGHLFNNRIDREGYDLPLDDEIHIYALFVKKD